MRIDSTVTLQPVLYASADQTEAMQWLVLTTEQAALKTVASGSGIDNLLTTLASSRAVNNANNEKNINWTNKINGAADTVATIANATLIIAAQWVITRALWVPSAKPQHIRDAVPHLLAEWTASELDQLHIVFGARSDSGWVAVAAVDRTLLTGWLAAIEPAVMCERIVVDALLMPYRPATLTIALDAQRALLRWSADDGGAIEIDSLPALLSALLQSSELTHIQLFVAATPSATANNFLQTQLPALEQRHALTIERQLFTGTLLELIATWLHERLRDIDATPLNLRQGDFAAPIRHSQWRRWRPTANVAAVCLAAQLLASIISGVVLEQRAQTLHAQTEKLYRELFPQDKRLVNLPQQLQTHLGVLDDKAHASLLILFSHLTKAIQATPSDSPIQLRSLNFDASNGALQVEISLSNVQMLDALQKRLSADQLAVQVLSAATDNGVLISRLSIASH